MTVLLPVALTALAAGAVLVSAVNAAFLVFLICGWQPSKASWTVPRRVMI
jgi:hypothetical protein